MPHHDPCPVWAGYLLASPLRRLMLNPRALLRPYVTEGMTILEPGPAMGFFTLELARLAGTSGRVVAVDVQQRMLDRLIRRAKRIGLAARIDARLGDRVCMHTADLAGKVDFALAFACVHEMPSTSAFFHEAFAALRKDAQLLFAEPTQIEDAEFQGEVSEARRAGFRTVKPLAIRGSWAVLLRK